MTRPIPIGVVGLGFMGRTHVAAFRAAHAAGLANRLVAVADSSRERLTGRVPKVGNLSAAKLGEGDDDVIFDAKTVRGYTTPQELFADREVELVSICTPTPTHVELALQALAAGKHVLLEKPVALASSDVARLADAARAARTLCMPAMCMRFWPGWDWLRERVRDGSFGRVKSATFRRLGTPPTWSAGFYDDPEKSGGALFDLHVHDADFIRWCFGAPSSVTSTGSLEHVTTLYRFPNGPAHVVAEGALDHTPGFGFRMRYTVIFERATADFDIGREPKLLLAENGEAKPVELAATAGYDGEIAHLLAAIATGRRELAATLDEAVGLTRMLEAERRSLRTGMPVAC
ncbi:MAG: Gfo/Idh/MocA family oxidoreductase [Planctomycetes bacterium]|nr:Gfo/Idh/MocA family oxidoreductase [Planctomycetota bacterium]